MRRAAALAAVVLWSASAAQAHVVIPGIAGFPGGLLHPLLVLSHALTLIALGLLLGLQPLRERLLLIATFTAAMFAAFGVVTQAYSTDRAELAVLALALVLGLLLAAWPKPPPIVAAVLAALTGGAVLVDSVPAVPSVRETVLTLCGTALAATVLLTLAAFASAAMPAIWPRIGVRIAGSWIAASAILVLALRLAKP